MTATTDSKLQYPTGAISALLLMLSCSSAFAANEIKSECDEVNKRYTAAATPTPQLKLKITDFGLNDSTADMTAPAADPADETVTSPALADADDQLSDADEGLVNETDSSLTMDDLPETALTLPGVADEDLPRFRRQMYRTDI